MLSDANASCSKNQLAEILGVTQRQVERLTASGVLKATRGKSGNRYSLATAVQSYLAYQCEYVIKRAKGGNTEYEAARARRMKALAMKEELSLAAQQGFFHRSDDLEFCITSMLTNARQRLLAIPSRVMHSLVGRTSARETNQIVDDEIGRALIELSESQFKQSIEFRTAQQRYLRQRVSDEKYLLNGKESNGQERQSTPD